MRIIFQHNNRQILKGLKFDEIQVTYKYKC